MTEFEMAYLLTDMQATAATSFGVDLSVTSGFLVSGYILGHRLNWLMIGILVTLYTIYMFSTAIILSRMQVSIVGLLQKMSEATADGKTLTWHAVHTLPPPRFVADTIGTSTLVVSFAVWAGAIAFFVIARNMNLKQEREEAAAKVAAAAPPPALNPAKD